LALQLVVPAMDEAGTVRIQRHTAGRRGRHNIVHIRPQITQYCGKNIDD
jgi:hypothetical protein